MRLFCSRRSTAVVLIFLHLSMGLFSTLPRFAWAQTSDLDQTPPTIDFDAITTGNASDSQVFAATVVDDVGVQSLKLFYRFAENADYQNREMRMLGSSGIYTVTLENVEVPDSADFIQYYIEAIDVAGNKSFQGFSFDPIERQLITAAEVAAAPPGKPVSSDGLPWSRKIIYGAVGLLIVGVLASASSSGGGGSSAGVPVTVVVDQLP